MSRPSHVPPLPSRLRPRHRRPSQALPCKTSCPSAPHGQPNERAHPSQTSHHRVHPSGTSWIRLILMTMPQRADTSSTKTSDPPLLVHPRSRLPPIVPTFRVLAQRVPSRATARQAKEQQACSGVKHSHPSVSATLQLACAGQCVTLRPLESGHCNKHLLSSPFDTIQQPPHTSFYTVFACFTSHCLSVKYHLDVTL